MKNLILIASVLIAGTGCASQVAPTSTVTAPVSSASVPTTVVRNIVRGTVYIPSDAPIAAQDQISAAVTEWQGAVPGSIDLNVVIEPSAEINVLHTDGHAIRFVFKSSFEDDVNGLCPQQNSTAGVVLADASEQNGVATLCMMNYTDTDYTVRTLAEHEMGHVFGLRHEDNEIMQAEHSDTIHHLTAGDISQFCSHWDCQ